MKGSIFFKSLATFLLLFLAIVYAYPQRVTTDSLALKLAELSEVKAKIEAHALKFKSVPNTVEGYGKSYNDFTNAYIEVSGKYNKYRALIVETVRNNSPKKARKLVRKIKLDIEKDLTNAIFASSQVVKACLCIPNKDTGLKTYTKMEAEEEASGKIIPEIIEAILKVVDFIIDKKAEKKAELVKQLEDAKYSIIPFEKLSVDATLTCSKCNETANK
jgi:hypothetical protein